MQSGQPVTGIPLTLGFDPKALQVLSVVEGPFLKGSGGQIVPTTFSQRIDNAGQVMTSEVRNGSTTGATLPGVVVTLSMKALAPPNELAETRLQVLSAAPVGLSGRSLVMPLPAPLALTITR